MIPKTIGRDCELSTTGVDPSGNAISPWEVTRSVLDDIDALFEPLGLATWSRASRYAGYTGATSSDCLRHWGPNGQCFYADMSHVELCTAETTSPYEYVAQCLCAIEVVEAARRRAEAGAPEGTTYALSTSNIDVLDPAVSWGTHLNVSVERKLWECLFDDPRHPSVLGFVASAIGAAIAFFGAGYVLPLRDGSSIYSLSGRAHHLSRITTYSTTTAFKRGLLNSRREPHAQGLDRLHLIGFDFSLVGAALQCSFVQCLLAAAEEGYGGLNVFDPVRATRLWSWSLDPREGRFVKEVEMAEGGKLSLPAYIEKVATVLLNMVDSGLITNEAAPDARLLLPRIIELAQHAAAGRITECARHLDWAAKLMVLLDVSGGGPMDGPEVRLADHDFGNTDPDRGAFWRLWSRDLVDPLVSREAVAACRTDGPARGRGWGRGRLIQKFPDDISSVDWGYVELRKTREIWGRRLRVGMPCPDSRDRESFQPLLDHAEDLDQLAALLAADEIPATESDPVIDIEDQLDSWEKSQTC